VAEVSGTSPASPEVLLAEYKSLKAEQQQRIGTRDNLLYATFTTVAVVLAAVLTSRAPAALLAAPPVMQVLGWTYLRNDIKVNDIRRYIARVLAPALGDGALGWELDAGHDGMRRVRRAFQVTADITAFPGASAALALAAVIAQSLRPGLGLAVLVAAGGAAEVACGALLGWAVIRAARLGPGS
jgi:hypothetical protein